MKNKKGQSLVIFVILLPLLIMGLALVVDVGIMYNAKTKGERLLEEAKKGNLDIYDYFKLNDIEANIEKTSNKTGSCVIIKYKIDSIFGKIIGLKEYDIEINDC